MSRLCEFKELLWDCKKLKKSLQKSINFLLNYWNNIG